MLSFTYLPFILDGHHSWKDLVLVILVIGGGVGFWYGYQQNKKFKLHVNRMCRDMEGLQNAELTLEKLQKELEEARKAEKTVASEKENLEKRLQESEADSTTLQHSLSDGEVSQLKAEIEVSKVSTFIQNSTTNTIRTMRAALLFLIFVKIIMFYTLENLFLQ